MPPSLAAVLISVLVVGKNMISSASVMITVTVVPFIAAHATSIIPALFIFGVLGYACKEMLFKRVQI
jgi:hypothetical protein